MSRIISVVFTVFALLALAGLGQVGSQAMLVVGVVALGLFNGIFAVATIGAMMALAGQGREAREGTRMGLWGAAQAVAAGVGGLLGAALADLLRALMPSDAAAFGTVFVIEAGIFAVATVMAVWVMAREGDTEDGTLQAVGGG